MNTGNAAEPPAFDFTAEGIKTLSSDIQKVSLTAQITKKGKSDTFLVDIELNKNPFTGGAQDWNSIATDVSNLSKRLFARPEAVRINFAFRSPDNNNIDWAHVFVTLDKLPKGWAEITYLEFFSFVRPLPGTLQAGQWLCDFYKKYESAMPQGKLPPSCKD
jgi:hypothetical protein